MSEANQEPTSRRYFMRGAAASATGAAIAAVGLPESTSGAGDDRPAGVQYGMVIDVQRCIGCHACTAACKAENDVPTGVNRSWVEYVEQGEYPSVSRSFLPRICNHCSVPQCVSVCPTGATYKRPEDGIVIIDSGICIGCKYCIQACPYDARFLNPVTGFADKCDFCIHRVSKGGLPACVETCVGGALIFGDLSDPDSTISKIVAKSPVTVLRREMGTMPNVYYIGANYTDDSDAKRHEVRNVRITTHRPHEKRRRPMHDELTWGLPVVLYLFLAGTGAGAVTVSASVLLRGGGFGPSRYEVARHGAFIGPLPVIIGTAFIIFELGAPFRVLNLFKVINLSPMSIGSWFLAAFIAVSLVYAATFLAPQRFSIARSLQIFLAWICVPLGIGVAIYTGVLLGSMPARPFWNSPIVAFLFLLSALSAGTACIVLSMTLFRRMRRAEQPDVENSSYLLTSADAILLAGEFAIIFLFIMFAHLTIGSTKQAVQVILPGGELSLPFWGLVVVLGIVIPFVIEIILIGPRLLYNKSYRAHRAIEIALPIAVLIGGFTLRYVVVVAGQITGPVGL